MKEEENKHLYFVIKDQERDNHGYINETKKTKSIACDVGTGGGRLRNKVR